jgi:hypothetical protein
MWQHVRVAWWNNATVSEESAASIFKVETMKIEVTESSGTLVTFCHTVRHHIPKHRNLHFQCENLIFCSDIATDLYKVQYKCSNVGFEVLTAVFMKSIIFWDMTPCSPLSANRRFGGTYRLHLQGRRNKFSKKLLVRRLVHGCWRFHSVIRTSQWEPSSSLLLPFCFLYNPDFWLAD